MAQIKTVVRIIHQDYIAMGPGKADLLDSIASQGSISAAAKHMRMSYKRAWDLVTIMNGTFKQPLVLTAIGGSQGGGASLSPLGKEVLQQYRTIQTETEQFVFAKSQALINLLT